MNHNEFVNQCMLTCIGNKRRLLKNIVDTIEELKIDKKKLNIFDGFAGSSVVSRELSQFADNLYVNDLEPYSYAMARCYFKRPTDEQIEIIKSHIDTMNSMIDEKTFTPGFISKLYAPKDDKNIQRGERCFYTTENANIIDTCMKYVHETVEPELFYYCIVPLLIKASIHVNTAGVFKGFYKNKKGIGQFGGENRDALDRIEKQIRLDYPVWSDNRFTGHVFNKDVNESIKELPDDIDIVYFDPPYNQHPYSSNYFMLNLILSNKPPENPSRVSGIPSDWNRSEYNYKKRAIKSMKDLIQQTIVKTRYIIISYNNEGIITDEDWESILSEYEYTKKTIKYDAYKGSRNLKNRSDKVEEILYIINLKNK